MHTVWKRKISDYISNQKRNFCPNPPTYLISTGEPMPAVQMILLISRSTLVMETRDSFSEIKEIENK